MNFLLAHAEGGTTFSMEHLHVVLNHLPVVGLATGMLALVLALILRNRTAQIVGLSLILVMSASAWPVVYTGQHAYKPIRSMADDEGTEWLDTHMKRAEKLAIAFYILSALSAAALAVPKKWPKSALPLTLATLVLAAACVGAGGWIAEAGGKIRHPEFRGGEATTPHATPTHTH